MFNKDALFGQRGDTTDANVTGMPGSHPHPRPVSPALPADPSPAPSANLADTPSMLLNEAASESEGAVARARSRAPAPSDSVVVNRAHRLAAEPVRVEDSSETTSTIAKSWNIKGVGSAITGVGTLIVEGEVESEIECRVIRILPGGLVTGPVTAEVAEVYGTVIGELTATKRLVLFSTGNISGRIRYGKIHVEEGAEISGDVNTLAAVHAAVAEVAADEMAASRLAAVASSSTQPSTSGDDSNVAESEEHAEDAGGSTS
ncbi:MAG: cell shape determination protein CcmA [Candidatus Nomurabacteria bacterium]|nr:cell shape determination protein CcmA [Candidatus Nomurabacteria bacterium]